MPGIEMGAKTLLRIGVALLGARITVEYAGLAPAFAAEGLGRAGRSVRRAVSPELEHRLARPAEVEADRARSRGFADVELDIEAAAFTGRLRAGPDAAAGA